MLRVLVAIPVYNESRYVRQVLEAVHSYSDDILVIDDGSTDGTADILERYTDIRTLTHAENKGYGHSLIHAFAWARLQNYDWVITLDCDYQHEPSCIPRFRREIAKDDTDIISGSRYLLPCDQGNSPAPRDRVLINQMITHFLNKNLNLGLTDAFCGFKACRTNAVCTLELTEQGYAFPLQLWILASKMRLRIREVAVPLVYPDPKRHFPGILSNPTARMRYYRDTIERELSYCDDPRPSTNLCSNPGRRHLHVPACF